MPYADTLKKAVNCSPIRTWM